MMASASTRRRISKAPVTLLTCQHLLRRIALQIDIGFPRLTIADTRSFLGHRYCGVDGLCRHGCVGKVTDAVAGLKILGQAWNLGLTQHVRPGERNGAAQVTIPGSVEITDQRIHTGANLFIARLVRLGKITITHEGIDRHFRDVFRAKVAVKPLHLLQKATHNSRTKARSRGSECEAFFNLVGVGRNPGAQLYVARLARADRFVAFGSGAVIATDIVAVTPDQPTKKLRIAQDGHKATFYDP